MQKKPTIVIAGANGYIGKWFIATFAGKYRIIALSRREVVGEQHPDIEWRQVELYSITSTTMALQGADYAIYLIHSMSPSTRLNQGSFEDTDLLLADNFARAAQKVGIQHILYLGGILPKETGDYPMSKHLSSRLEVEETLSAKGIPFTALRAGIIVGPGGSSFQMIEKLVRKLPVMACPKWTLSETQAISLRDTLQIMDVCLGNPEAYGRVFEIGSPEVLSYKQMMELAAKAMGKKRYIFSVPVFSVGFSKLWVGFFSDSPSSLVSPLVESLRHTLTVDPALRFDLAEIDYLSYEESVSDALARAKEVPCSPTFKKEAKPKNTVRSIQRLPNTRHRSAQWVANRYKVWLPTFFSVFINAADNGKGEVAFYPLFFKKPMLKLSLVPDRSDHKRQLFYITGGWLVKRIDYGWLEFREVLGGKHIMTAIHEFVPRLPWIIYVNTQAIAHVWVMRRFSSYLKKYHD
ncbi:NAD-dependent epimerase/dehydratase [Nitritalea halalkaliphila LW7]|uniref:NAD-dependent epimerase/dehydratase n=1 Tax=Nitritalea halalkaliphila LW7 TaxID=1189621 RepID=I5CAQ5_9BACT|nr:NmrA family NAD(P)-binding protein [Nitritalea halalkaliphila]EIM78907.1 NAD-dependent epimerase/dehydratase [Nitritalea halalkaliphila LW7]